MRSMWGLSLLPLLETYLVDRDGVSEIEFSEDVFTEEITLADFSWSFFPEVSDASGADFPFFFWRLAKVSAEFSDASFSVKKNNK